MIDLPHKVRVTGRTSYEVVWVDRFDDPECVGLCDSEKKIIYLLKGMSPRRTLQVFIHEVLHALEFHWKVKIPHSLIYDLEEPIVRLVELNELFGFRKKAKK